MANEWYIRDAGKTVGPLSSAELRTFAESGKLTPQSALRMGAEGDWVPASRVRGLFDGLPAAAATSAPPSARAPAPAQPTGRAASAQPPVAPPPAEPPPAPPPVASFQSPWTAAKTPEKRSFAAGWLGIAAIFAGLVGMSLCWIPIAGLSLGVMGILLGIAGIVASFAMRARGLALAAGGGSLALIAALASVAYWYVAVRVAETFVTMAPVHAQPILQPTPQPPIQVAPTPAPAPVEPAPAEVTWTSSDSTAALGDLEFAIAAVSVSSVRTMDLIGNRQKAEMRLSIRLTIKNTSASRKIDYPGFQSGALLASGAAGLLGGQAAEAVAAAQASLHDDLLNTYRQVGPAAGGDLLGISHTPSIYPGKQINETLLFEQPVPNASFLRLELPGEAIGQMGTVRFQIPAASVVGLSK